MADRSRDWLAQAEHDLEVANALRDAGRHAWACFAAEQAAEKAVHATNPGPLHEPWRASIRNLLQTLTSAPAALIDKARVLDTHCIASRYPHLYSSGASFENYGARQSDTAIRYAGEIVQFVRSQLAGAR